jgi:hypothetical protein
VTKEEVLAAFDIDFKDPESQKDGPYLFEHILRRTKGLIISDRAGTIEALKYWLSLRKEPQTMMAVNIANNLALRELTPELITLGRDIESGSVFLPYYKGWVERALKAIS